MIVQKLPDYEGGFITKEVEGNIIITRDNEGNILFTEPVNVLRKGLNTGYGRIIEIREDRVTLLKGTKEITADRHLLNSCLLKEINPPLNKSLNNRKVSGTFITPLGKIEVDEYEENTRAVLTNPDRIVHNSTHHWFEKRIDDNIYTATVEKKLLKEPLLKSLSVETAIKRPRKLLFKALPKTPIFNIGNTSAKGTTGSGWNQKGGVKPGHKYIERKPHPSGEGYIYLYELSSGKRIWRDKDGNQIKGAKPAEAEKTEQLNFQAGDAVKMGDRIGKVIKTSDNFLAINFEGKVETINKREHLERLKEERQYREKQIIDYKGKRAKILRLADKLALIKEMESGDYKVIKLAKEITPAKEGDVKKQGRKFRESIDKYSYVYQGYGELDRRYDYDPEELENDKDYQEFQKAAEEAGFGRVDDITMRKFVKVGDETYSVVWEYDPKFGETDILIDGLKEYPIEYGGERFIVRDISEKGYSLENPETGETGIFLDHKDYEQWKNEQREKEKAHLVITRTRRGDEIIKDTETKTIRYTPEYTQEELERFRGGRRRTSRTSKSSEPIQNENRITEIEKEQAQIAENIKKALDSESYNRFKKQVEERGFNFGENKFIGRKSVNIEGRKFDVRAVYDMKSEQYRTEVNGPAQTVQIDEEHYPITDVYEDKIAYRKGNYEKKISINELKEKNGKGIFSKTALEKVELGKTRPIRLANGETHDAQFAIVELDNIFASHDEESFKPTENYPVDENGNNINDRNYEGDKNLQETVKLYARELDPFQLINNNVTSEGTPIISQDGFVVSGNNRTMSTKLAKSQHPERWKDYQNELRDQIDDYGIDPSVLEKFENPFLVRIDNDFKKYSKSELQKYNQDTKKGESEVDEAIKIHDIIKNTENMSKQISDITKDFGTMSEMLSNNQVQQSLRKLMLSSGIVTENKISDYFTSEGKLTGKGQNLAKKVLKASVLNPEGLKAGETAGVKNVVNNMTDNLSVLLQNKSLNEDYSLNNEVNKAISLQNSYMNSGIKEKGGTFEQYISQQNMFDGDAADYRTIALNMLSKKGPRIFAEALKKYNRSAAENQEGGMFGGFTKDEIFEELIVNGKRKIEADEDKAEAGKEKPFFTEEERELIKPFIKKSFGARLRRLIKGSIKYGKNLLLPSKKNPSVRRWQKHEFDEKSDQLGLFEQTEKRKEGENEKGRKRIEFKPKPTTQTTTAQHQEPVSPQPAFGKEPEFESLEEANDWIDKKINEYGSKNKFLSSDEYKKAYPQIEKLHKQEKQDFNEAAKKAMKESGVDFGDRVEYSRANPFGEVFVYEGVIENKNGLPKVKLDKKTMDGKRYLNWHKGFRKVEAKPPTIKRAYDAFKKNNAPQTDYIDEHGRERKAYNDEAYKEYMDVSDETGKKIRWGVELSDGRKVSFDGAIRITKPKVWEKIQQTKSKEQRAQKLWNALSEDEKKEAIKGVDLKSDPDDDVAVQRELRTLEHPFADVYDFREQFRLAKQFPDEYGKSKVETKPGNDDIGGMENAKEQSPRTPEGKKPFGEEPYKYTKEELSKPYRYAEMYRAIDDFPKGKALSEIRYKEGDVVFDYNEQKLHKITKDEANLLNKSEDDPYSLDMEEGAELIRLNYSVPLGPEKTYYRFGELPKENVSYNNMTNEYETGVSVYLTPVSGSFATLDRSDIYFGKGRQVGWGGDDEPLIVPTSEWKSFVHKEVVQQAIKEGKIDSHPDYPELTNS